MDSVTYDDATKKKKSHSPDCVQVSTRIVTLGLFQFNYSVSHTIRKSNRSFVRLFCDRSIMPVNNFTCQLGRIGISNMTKTKLRRGGVTDNCDWDRCVIVTLLYCGYSGTIWRRPFFCKRLQASIDPVTDK